MLTVITSTVDPEVFEDLPVKMEEMQPRPPSIGAYLLLDILGIGEFGKVKLGKHIKTSQEVAVKLIDKKRVQASEVREKVDREIAILKQLSHPSIVKLLDVIETEVYIGIVLDYARGGELFEYILAHTRLGEDEACALFAQLVSSIHYMHQKGVVHRDLKLENILLMDERHIIITDFGFANQAMTSDDLLATCCGSPCYAAPELLAGEKYAGPPVDVWSCGVVLYAMLCGFLPFDDNKNINQLYKEITEDPLILPTHVSESAGQLLCQMLEPDPKRRCTVEDIMAHPWLAEHHHIFRKTLEELENDGINIPHRKVPVEEEEHMTPLPLLLNASSSNSTSSINTEKRTTHAPQFIYASVKTEQTVDAADSSADNRLEPRLEPSTMENENKKVDDSVGKRGTTDYIKAQEVENTARAAAVETDLASRAHETSPQKRHRSFWARLFRRKKSASKKRSTWIAANDKDNDERYSHKFMTWIRKTKSSQAGLSAIFGPSGVDHDRKVAAMTTFSTLESCFRANKETLILHTSQSGADLLRLLLSILELLGIQVEHAQEEMKLVCHRSTHQAHEPTSLAVFGDPSVDNGEQVTFTVQVCRVSPQVQMVDVRRIQGEYRAYQFLCSKFLDMVELFVKQK